MQKTIRSTILLGSTGVSAAGFGVPLILGAHDHFPERIRFYSSPAALETDLPSGSAELAAGLLAMQQRPRASVVAIGRRDSTGATNQADQIALPATVNEGETFQIKLDGFTVAKYIAGDSETDATLAAALVALVNNSGAFTVASVSGTNKIDLAGAFPGVGYLLTVDGPVGFTVTPGTSAAQPTETAVAALNAIEAENAGFYGVCTTSRNATDIAEIAGWCESRQKFFVAVTSSADVKAAGTADLASTLKALSLQKTLVFYTGQPWFAYGAALLSNRLAVDPDSNSTTWNLVLLIGVPMDRLSETEETNLQSKNVYYYVDDGAGGAGKGGKAIGGEWVDVVIGVDWFNARLQESTYSYVKSMTNVGKKVPYTDAGVNTLEAILRRRLDAAKATGFIAEDPAPEIESPRVLEVDPVKRQARELPPIKWNARLAGAIHFTNFEGVLVP